MFSPSRYLSWNHPLSLQKKKNLQKTLKINVHCSRACIKKSWNDFSLKKKSLPGKKSNGEEGRNLSEKSRKLKASYRANAREHPFSLYEENFFPLGELFKSGGTIDKRILSSSGNYSQHANKEPNDSRLKSLSFSLCWSVAGRGPRLPDV